MIGSVTRRNVTNGEAPKSAAASSRRQSKPRMRAFTVVATYDTQNMTCAITMVTKPRLTSADTNKVSSEKPSTISGIVSGSTSSVLTKPLPRKRYFTRASDIAVPITTASVVATKAMRMLKRNAAVRSLYLNGFFHASSEKRPHW